MTVDIARVFSDSWSIIKQRFLVLLGMWVVFFVINIVYTIVAGGVLGGSIFALGAAASSGLDDPELLLGGLGIGAILMMILFYIGSIVIILAQQCAMSALSTPLREVQFGDAIKLGLKAGVTFIAITVLVVIAYILVAIVYGIIGVVLSLAGDIGTFLSVLLFVPVLIYLGLRISVIVPVVAVDRTFNPITAIRRTWSMTAGKVLSILVVYLAIIAIALVLLGLPFLMMFGSAALAGATGSEGAAVAAAGTIVGGFLLLIPMFLLYSIVTIVIIACLHAQLTDTPAEEVARTFE